MQVLQCNRTILSGSQVLFYQITFAVHFCAISSNDIRSGIHVINSIFLSTVFILKYSSALTDLCSCQNLSFFINGKFCQLFLVFHGHSRDLTCYQFHICCRCVYHISLWCCDLFQINGILCLNDRNRGFSIFICCRHLSDQLCTSLITVYTKHCTCKINIRCIVFLYDFDRSLLNPGYFEVNIFFICYTFTKYQRKILRIRSGGDFISRVIFCNTSLHCRRPALCHVTHLCQWCRKIKFCSSANLYTCTGFTCCACTQIMKFHTRRKLHRNCL